MKWILPILFLCSIFGCANKELPQLAHETMENARLSISVAEKVGAREVAVTSINSAEEMLLNSESSLLSGDVEKAYRLGLRSYLHARIAAEKSLAVRLNSQLKEAQAMLRLQEKATEETRNELETLKAERDKSKN